MKIVAVLVLLVYAAFGLAGNPTVDLYGTIADYRDSKVILVKYKNGPAAEKDAKKCGFEVVENYKPGRFLVCKISHSDRKGTPVVALVKLVSCDSVEFIEPNYKVQLP